jgi:hypothetical protein
MPAVAACADEDDTPFDIDSIVVSDASSAIVKAVPIADRLVATSELDAVEETFAEGPLESVDERAASAGCVPDVWIVNTRATVDACCSTEVAEHCVRFAHLRQCRWTGATLQDFNATANAAVPVIIWVHGNNSDAEAARESGWKIYQLLRRCSPGPIRFVIWSWPSERSTVFAVPDVRLKASISEEQGLYLAWFLDRIPPQLAVGIIGYSYGTRVTSAALHLLGGGVIQRCSLGTRVHPDRTPVRVFFMAAAQDANGFAPWGRYRRAPLQITQLVVLKNDCDMVLRCYPRLEQPGGPPALGAVGLSGISATPLARAQVREIDVSDDIHCFHAFRHYVNSPVIAAQLRQFNAEGYDVCVVHD